MTTALAIYDKFDQLQRAAMALQQSGYFKDVATQAQAIVKVMAGAELGLPPFASMTGIHIIQGKPVLGANVIATLVKNSAQYDHTLRVCDNKNCELAWFENGKQTGTSHFSWDEAKAAGLTGKDNWAKYPSDMLFARAISRGARRFAPGIFGGAPVYTPDEMGQEVDPDGYIDATAKDVTEQSAQEQPAELMDYQQACLVENSENKSYGEIVTEKLTHMYNKMGQLLKNSGSLTEEKITEYTFKRGAIESILAHRSAAQAGE